jgi:hypothetical protein
MHFISVTSWVIRHDADDEQQQTAILSNISSLIV